MELTIFNNGGAFCLLIGAVLLYLSFSKMYDFSNGQEFSLLQLHSLQCGVCAFYRLTALIHAVSLFAKRKRTESRNIRI